MSLSYFYSATMKCRGTYGETIRFLDGIISRHVGSTETFVHYVKNRAARLVPDNYRYGKNWRKAPQALNPTEEFIVRIAYELQSGDIRAGDLVRSPSAIFSKKDTNGHHLRRIVLRRKILEKEVGFAKSYYPWLLNVLRCR